LLIATIQEHYDVARYLLLKGANVHLADERGYSPIYNASKNGDVRMVSLLIDHKCNVNQASEDGNSPLLSAIAGGHSDVVRILIKHGADIHHTAGNYGLFPLYASCGGCGFGYEDIVDILLENDVNVNQALSSDGSTSLLIVIEKGYFSIVKKLINASADMHQASHHSFPLYIASWMNHEDIVDYLLEKQVKTGECESSEGRRW